ncbi:hypothetical protein [Methylocaldum gracile]|jgi:hypothetical protein|uniref:hypothetical protein n=1 Tax=Methylocaldum sp. 0917 TaxID=2485163 RepID=UPI0010621BEE
MYKSFDLFNEFLSQNAEKMTNDELREALDNAPYAMQRSPVWAFWDGFWHGRESARWASLPVFIKQQQAVYQAS